MIIRIAAFAAGLALGAVAQATAQLTTPAPTPQPQPAQTQTTAPQPASTTTPPPVATPNPTPTPPNPYKYVVEPPASPGDPPGTPVIVRIELNDQNLHPGGQLAVRITTSPDVRRVIASTEGHDLEIQPVPNTPGLFAGLTTLPGFIPPWFFKTYNVTIIVTTAENRRTQYTLPINLGR